MTEGLVLLVWQSTSSMTKTDHDISTTLTQGRRTLIAVKVILGKIKDQTIHAGVELLATVIKHENVSR